MSKKTGIIVAFRNGQRTEFTETVWDLTKGEGGRNGWIAESEGGNAGKTKASASVSGDLETEGEYKKIMAQGKGLEKDGNLTSALLKYQAAYKLKATPALKGKITKLENTIDNDAKLVDLLVIVEGLRAEGNFEDALEMKEAAEMYAKTKGQKAELKEVFEGIEAEKLQADALAEEAGEDDLA